MFEFTQYASPLIAALFLFAGQFFDRAEGGWPDLPGRGWYYAALLAVVLIAASYWPPLAAWNLMLLAAGLIGWCAYRSRDDAGDALAPRGGDSRPAFKFHSVAVVTLGFFIAAAQGFTMAGFIFSVIASVAYVYAAVTMAMYQGKMREKAERLGVNLSGDLNAKIERIRGALYFGLAWLGLAVHVAG